MKREIVTFGSERHASKGILLIPERPRQIGVILAHGAGGNMHAPFMTYFHEEIAKAGFPALKFNFPYSEAKRKSPDPQPVLISCYRNAIEAVQAKRLVIGGKSMGGRIASYVAADNRIAGLLFLGYPLHAPGKTDQLRDEHLYTIHKPMLFASGTKDPFARIDLLKKTIGKIGKYASAYYVEGGGHSLDVSKKKEENEKTLQAVCGEIIQWLKTSF